MSKQAIVVVSLVLEAEKVSNERIKIVIFKDSFIPWCRKVEEVTIVDCDEIRQMLKQRNYSAGATEAIIELYL